MHISLRLDGRQEHSPSGSPFRTPAKNCSATSLMNLVSSYLAPSRPCPVSDPGYAKILFPSESLNDTWMCLAATSKPTQSSDVTN